MHIFDLASVSTETIIDLYEKVHAKNSAEARALRKEIEIRCEEHKKIHGAVPLMHSGVSYTVDHQGFLYRTAIRWRINAA
jgi:hypothetical protein